MVLPIQSDSNIVNGSFDCTKSSKITKALHVALSILMALGLILSYVLHAPWLVMVGFFFLCLLPLFPLGKVIDQQRSRILE